MKVKTFILIALVAMFTACTPSLESLISQYEKAATEGDVVKAEMIIAKIDKHYNESDMTILQAKRLATASLKLITNTGTGLMESATMKALDAMDDMINEAYDVLDVSVQDANDVFDYAMDEALDAMDDAMDEALDAMDDAMDEAYDDLDF
jgi:septation ring formation regulator EzrA